MGEGEHEGEEPKEEQGRQPLRTVWFETWKYDRMHDVRTALIRRVLLDMRKNADAGWPSTTD